MFAVVYSFDVRPERRTTFLDAWKNLTQLIYEYEGSRGSRLHHSEGNIYMAYAVWPNRKTWEESGTKLPTEAEGLRSIMRESCVNIETIHTWEVVEDLINI